MQFSLDETQLAARDRFRAFVDDAIAPRAAEFDQQQATPPDVIRALVDQQLLGTLVREDGGRTDTDLITYGLLHQEVGRGCSSVRSLITVHDMTTSALAKWGTGAAKAAYLPGLATGRTLGGFALSEVAAGSDAQGIQMRAVAEGPDYLLDGRKKWITYGQIADLFLIFAQTDDGPAAFVVERGTPGLTTRPIEGMMGFRASMLAEVELSGCRVSRDHLLGRPGFGVAGVAIMALDLGRYSVAWGCVGIGQACVEASLQHTASREQFGVPLNEHQLVQAKLSRMLTDVEAARLLCLKAGAAMNARDPDAMSMNLMAKYFASTMVTKVAKDAVQLHGASGCSNEKPVGRYLRDAQVMEIIEGSTHIHEMLIARHCGR